MFVYYAKTVHLEVRVPIETQDQLVVPITWQATGTPGLFPRMDAELIVAPLGSLHTQIAFRGTYEPPFGALGGILDRWALHRVAEATVKHFVDRLGAAVIGWPHVGGT